MRFSKTITLHKKLIEYYGKDIVISVSYDDEKYYLSISVHKSNTWEYNHGRDIQTCLLDNFRDDIDVLFKKIVLLYDEVLVRKKS
tara:strand:- start:340 stop:594 length:255 start_codon:yes stop_codon:yes gene_type:complete